MSKKKQEKKQPAGKLAIALLILTALVFMMLGPRAKANSHQDICSSIHLIHPGL